MHFMFLSYKIFVRNNRLQTTFIIWSLWMWWQNRLSPIHFSYPIEIFQPFGNLYWLFIFCGKKISCNMSEIMLQWLCQKTPIICFCLKTKMSQSKQNQIPFHYSHSSRPCDLSLVMISSLASKWQVLKLGMVVF